MRRPEQRVGILARQPQRPPARALEQRVGQTLLARLHALADRIDTDPQRLVVLDSSPLRDDLLDPTLERLARGPERDTAGWIEQLASAHAEAIQAQALARLVARGILRREKNRFLWVFQARRYPVIDGRVINEVKLRITASCSAAISRISGISPSFPSPTPAASSRACCPARNWRTPGRASSSSAGWN